jgi:hypothetical protein
MAAFNYCCSIDWQGHIAKMICNAIEVCDESRDSPTSNQLQESGSNPEEAAAADRYMEEVLHVLPLQK